jgi:hypothetical protein
MMTQIEKFKCLLHHPNSIVHVIVLVDWFDKWFVLDDLLSDDLEGIDDIVIVRLLLLHNDIILEMNRYHFFLLNRFLSGSNGSSGAVHLGFFQSFASFLSCALRF